MLIYCCWEVVNFYGCLEKCIGSGGLFWEMGLNVEEWILLPFLLKVWTIFLLAPCLYFVYLCLLFHHFLSLPWTLYQFVNVLLDIIYLLPLIDCFSFFILACLAFFNFILLLKLLKFQHICLYFALNYGRLFKKFHLKLERNGKFWVYVCENYKLFWI